MRMNGLVGVLVIVGLVLVSAACAPRTVGDDRDAHGCLVSGYSFDEGIGACVRSWELNDSPRDVLVRAVEKHGEEYGLTIIGVEALDVGYSVTVETPSGRDEVRII